jgi:hypothetical protein
MMNFGKSKAKMYDNQKRRVRFSDVAGADEEKQELIEIVATFLIVVHFCFGFTKVHHTTSTAATLCLAKEEYK